MRLTEYTKVYDNAIVLADSLIDQLSSIMSNFTEDELILSSENFPLQINGLYAQREMLVQLKVRYLFDKMGKPEFERLIQAQEAGVSSKLLTVDLMHTVKDYETPQKIASLYGIEVSDLFLYNAITIEEFDDLKERMGVIKIPTTINLDDNSRFAELAVYGSVAGPNAWGIDWANAVIWNDTIGDIEKLDNEKTLYQGLLNSFGSIGDIPLHPGVTIEIQVSSDLPAELFDSIAIAQLENKIPKDVRYKKVSDVVVERASGARKITVSVLPINLENPLKPVEKEIPIIN